MKKMTLVMMIAVVIVGFYTAVFAGHGNRGGYGHDGKGHGTIRVAGQNWKKFQKERHCQPALINVWLNGKVTTVQVTTCRKKNGWIVSPVYINVGKQVSNQQKRSSWKENRMYNGAFFPSPPVGRIGR